MPSLHRVDLILTGYVDQYTINIGPGHHSVTITGRGIGADFYDSSADLLASPQLRGATISASNALDLASKLAKPFGIVCRSAVADLGVPILPFSIALGETNYEILERVARYSAYVIYEDQNGALVLDRVGTTSHASGFTMAAPAANSASLGLSLSGLSATQTTGNIESASSTLSFNQRFSTYAATFSSIMQYSEYSPISENIAVAVDPTMPSWRYRPKIIISEQVDPSQSLAQKRVDWEKARRIGRSQAISLTCDCWRDTSGALWQPNMLAPINAPALKIVNAQWIIGSVTFRKDRSGTHADVMLMPPAAFNPEPVALTLWDRETMHSVAPGGASPAPATQP